MSHYSAIGDTISCDAPYSAIGFRGKLFLRYPLKGLSLDCNRPFLKKEVGGVAAIVCDTTGNTVRQGYCYTCLAIGGGISIGSLRVLQCLKPPFKPSARNKNAIILNRVPRPQLNSQPQGPPRQLAPKLCKVGCTWRSLIRFAPNALKTLSTLIKEIWVFLLN